MPRLNYEPEFKKQIVTLHLESGRSISSLATEFNVSKSTLIGWIKKYREECDLDPKLSAERDYFKETLKLKKQVEELEKENRFLKKAAAFFAKEID